MNALIWNARGLGSPCAFHELRRLMAATSPRIVFLCETRLTSNKCNLWRALLGIAGLFVVDAKGQKGGLMLMWDSEVDVSILSYSAGHIDCVVKVDGKTWQFTGFYGNPATEERKCSWQLLRRIAESRRNRECPWLVGGDFNEILWDSEKQGGRVRSLAQMNLFREVMLDCNLHEVAYPDISHTWFNKREHGEVFERLDRYICDPRWQTEYPNSVTKVLDFYGSDHRPVLCMVEGEGEKMICKGKGRFHFEDKWMMDKQFVPDFACEWASLRFVADLPTKMKRCEDFFTKWAKGKFDKLGKKIAKLREARQRLMSQTGMKVNAQAILEVSRKIEQAVELEACHWKQRARVNWLANGDRNTRAFHIQASKRRKKDTIKKLKDGGGEWKEEEIDKAQIIQDYFRRLFSSNNPTAADIEEVVGTIREKLTKEDYDFLSKPYEELEVRKALFDMHPTKAPGPDGFNARFFQKFWPLVGDFVTAKVMDILNRGAALEEWNETLIALIPKVDKPEVVEEFRPLSLCNTCYKIVSKVIVNRLRQVLGRVIDQAQSAFIRGRLITDNILISFECQHWLRSR